MKVRASGIILKNAWHCSASFFFVCSSLCCSAGFRTRFPILALSSCCSLAFSGCPSTAHQSVEGALPGLNNFFCFLLALFFSVYTVHPATVTSGLSVEFVSDYCAYQVTKSLADMAGH
jgi:hypothetical protein